MSKPEYLTDLAAVALFITAVSTWSRRLEIFRSSGFIFSKNLTTVGLTARGVASTFYCGINNGLTTLFFEASPSGDFEWSPDLIRVELQSNLWVCLRRLLLACPPLPLFYRFANCPMFNIDLRIFRSCFDLVDVLISFSELCPSDYNGDMSRFVFIWVWKNSLFIFFFERVSYFGTVSLFTLVSVVTGLVRVETPLYGL